MKDEKELRGLMEALRDVMKMPAVHGAHPVPRGEFGFLAYLIEHREGATAGRLAQEFGLSSSRTADILRTLSAKGLVERSADKQDARRTQVVLTPLGRQLSDLKKSELKARLLALIAYLGEEDTQQLTRLLQRVAAFQEENPVPAAPAKAPFQGSDEF